VIGQAVERLQQGEAVVLAHALAHRIAAESGIRALIIKGPLAARSGLRPERDSTDVDIWVDPARFDDYLRALERAGWRPRPDPAIPRIIALHSLTYLHPGWPCDIDVHHSYPGFFADVHAVFDALWARRRTEVIGGVGVETTDRVGGALVVALHALRDLQVSRNAAEFGFLADAVRDRFTAAEKEQLCAVSAEMGANTALAPLFTETGLVPFAQPELPARAVLDLYLWRVRTRGVNNSTTAWLLALSQAQAREWPMLLREAVYPAKESFLRSHPESTPQRLHRARLARLRRGLLALPAASAAIVAPMLQRSAPGRRTLALVSLLRRRSG
jgi:hypothetical protein